MPDFRQEGIALSDLQMAYARTKWDCRKEVLREMIFDAARSPDGILRVYTANQERSFREALHGDRGMFPMR